MAKQKNEAANGKKKKKMVVVEKENADVEKRSEKRLFNSN